MRPWWSGPDGLTDFEALRRRGAGEIAVLYAFDLLELDGDDLRSLPIETRKATLASLMRKPGALRLSEHISADGSQVFAHACRLGAEGIVSKRLGSPYLVRAAPSLGQGAQSGEHRGAARAHRELEQVRKHAGPVSWI